MGAANDENAKADQGDAGPAKRRDVFTENEIAEDRDGSIGQGGGGLNVAVVGPGEKQHVHEKKAEKASDAEPEGRRKEGVIDEGKKIDEAMRRRRADVFHAFAEKDVAEWAEKDAQENEWKSFELQATSVFVVVSQSNASVLVGVRFLRKCTFSFYVTFRSRTKKGDWLCLKLGRLGAGCRKNTASEGRAFW